MAARSPSATRSARRARASRAPRSESSRDAAAATRSRRCASGWGRASRPSSSARLDRRTIPFRRSPLLTPWLRREATGLLQRAAKQIFDLRVDAPELVARPALQGLVRVRIDPEQVRLLVGHDYV